MLVGTAEGTFLLGKRATVTRQLDEGFDAPPSLREAVTERLRSEILEGRLAPGAPIRDAELASRLGVSITPIRESVTLLISEGLVEVLPNKRRRVTILTQRMAQELMDVVGIVLSAGFERLPSSPAERLAVAASCREFAEQIMKGERSKSEPSFESFVAHVLRAAKNEELTRMAEPAVRRAISMARLYPSRHLYDLWGRTFRRVADLVEEDPVGAADVVRVFTRDLLAAMAEDRPMDAEVQPGVEAPRAGRSG
jgi:DNA-binding GntR family transcriptional regulator